MDGAQCAITQAHVAGANRYVVKLPRSGEIASLALSFLYFLLLLASYYVLRPVRDSLVSGIGTDQVKFLSIAVLLAMLAITPLYGALMTHVPRYKLLPAIYAFAVCNLLLFAFVFSVPQWAEMSARVFYVWVMVFNLFVVSVFWSFMADIWNEEQGRRLFGLIAAGGSVGGLLGPTLARTLSADIGNSGLSIVAALLLSGAILCLFLLGRNARTPAIEKNKLTQPLTGSSWQGVLLIARSPFLLGIGALVAIGAIAGIFAYIELGRLAKEAFDTSAARTAFFARIDFWVNASTLVFQAVVVGLLTSRWGIKIPLAGLAIIGCLSFIAVAMSPILAMLAITTVIRRTSEFGLGKPGRDMLYTVTSPQEKYLAKNVIDTVIYRSADVFGSWLHALLVAIGFTLAGLSWVAAAAMGLSLFIALGVVRGYRARGGK
jgi:AAA family ATP:ADP antiporter